MRTNTDERIRPQGTAYPKMVRPYSSARHSLSQSGSLDVLKTLSTTAKVATLDSMDFVFAPEWSTPCLVPTTRQQSDGGDLDVLSLKLREACTMEEGGVDAASDDREALLPSPGNDVHVQQPQRQPSERLVRSTSDVRYMRAVRYRYGCRTARCTLDEKGVRYTARQVSLDMVRGFTVAVMIFVDDLGDDWPPINHSPWNGITLADIVMPWSAGINQTPAGTVVLAIVSARHACPGFVGSSSWLGWPWRSRSASSRRTRAHCARLPGARARRIVVRRAGSCHAG